MNPESPIRTLGYSAIDFESAGAARGLTDIPVQVGIASWTPEHGMTEPFVSYLRSDRPVTWSARKVHGIRDEDLVGAPRLQELWPTLRKRLGGAVVVAHGKGTEKRFLRAFPGHGFGPWIDTLLLARAAWPDLGSHSLSALCEHRGLVDDLREFIEARKWHDALFDAAASLFLLRNIVDAFELADRPLECLLRPDLSEWHRLRRP
ncbi:DNA polymerase III, epsilon subunit [Haloferula helveola]|uniref:DNA polymerase III, epsilon subunit n=2 Tax=Haloferula helveola TaxID=490095 RepID=A0ABM7RFC6_9BACT|nr:DNA polymerase III, epsilon subunit [Haloferula helveola]